MTTTRSAAPLSGAQSLVHVLCAAVCLLLACAQPEPRGPAADRLASPAPAPAEATAAADSPSDIREVLDLLRAGRNDDAVHALLRLCDSGAPEQAYRPHHMKETDFVMMSPQRREATTQHLLPDYDALRDLARELDRRAQQALAHGDKVTARRLYLAMRQLGFANVGGDTTLLANAVGKAILRQALARLDELEASGPPEAGPAKN